MRCATKEAIYSKDSGKLQPNLKKLLLDVWYVQVASKPIEDRNGKINRIFSIEIIYTAIARSLQRERVRD